jgi:hypothetical protein
MHPGGALKQMEQTCVQVYKSYTEGVLLLSLVVKLFMYLSAFISNSRHKLSKVQFKTQVDAGQIIYLYQIEREKGGGRVQEEISVYVGGGRGSGREGSVWCVVGITATPPCYAKAVAG